jgi:hypothetical protein
MRLHLPVLLLALPGALAAAQEPPPVPAADSAASQGEASRRQPRRQPLTPELEASAFADSRARTLLFRAREARLAQDSALRSYDARSIQRLTLGLGIRRGFDRILFRGESASRISWSSGSGVWIEPTGRRAAAPMFGATGASMDIPSLTTIPYFPGRESLWIPSSTMGVAQVEVNENEMLHPLATGAEAYYRYAVGDSMSFRLPDGRSISLRELRIRARRPDWRAFVGSFWFDTERGSLVRAAYRMSAEMDIWQVAGEDAKREAEEALDKAKEDGPPMLARLIISPLKANLSAVTVEFGLYEGQFWLPKLQVAEGHAQAGFLRVPVRFEETFRYSAVNGPIGIPPIPLPEDIGLAPSDTSTVSHLTIGDGSRSLTAAERAAGDDTLLARYRTAADSLRRLADSVGGAGDTARVRRLIGAAERNERYGQRIIQRREACATDSTYVAAVTSRAGGTIRTATRLPCDLAKLEQSPDLPHPLFDPAEELFGTADRDELLNSLGISLQPGWNPQPPVVRTGLDMLRYNRIEGLSVGAGASSVLGQGYTARAEARIGTGDRIPNAELALDRSNGRRTITVGAFHRLGVANDDWGAPLSYGASAANLVYGRDEGFYYRAWGAELRALGEQPGPLGAVVQWRAFAERHRTAGVDPNSQVSLARAFGHDFGRNIDAAQLNAIGVAADLSRTFGGNPFGFRLATRMRAEGAFTDRSDSVGSTGYARGMFDGTLSRTFGRFGGALTGAAGGSAGDLPVQRAFFLGGLQTVRGQFARLHEGTGHVGEAFWLGRGELGLGLVAFRPVLFYDVGWAGPRSAFGRSQKPMSGAGAGVSVMDGLLRFDLSRGIHPETRWRADIQLGARF